MIQSNEIRIGSLLLWKNPNTGDDEIVTIDIEDFDLIINKNYAHNYFGVVLNAELLVNKLGFKQHHNGCYLGLMYIKHIDTNTPYVWGVYSDNLNGVVIADAVQLKYVHQLQNLYFALTGEELPIEL
jgi:hypothetical protein